MLKKTLLFILLFSQTQIVLAGNWTNGSYWSIWGTRSYQVYLPHNYDLNETVKKLPIVVALHGCMQDSKAFAAGTRLNKWADKMGFAVLYPEQDKLYNIYNCWNWFLPQNQYKNTGEAELIMGGLSKVIKQFNFDDSKVFLLGMSAGGAMATVLANCYPNNFQAVATHHSPMYLAAENPATAKEVVYNGSKKSPEVAATRGYACSGLKRTNKILPTLIIHGSKGVVMKPLHAEQVEEEMKAFNDFLDNGKRDNSLDNLKRIKKIHPKRKYAYELTTWSHKRKPYIYKYMIEELGHAWSGGDNQFEFNDPHGPDSTKIILDFFKKQNL